MNWLKLFTIALLLSSSAIAQTVEGLSIGNRGILTGMLADSSVIGRKIGTAAIGSVHLQDDMITGEKFDNTAFEQNTFEKGLFFGNTQIELKNSGVVKAKLANNSVDDDKYRDSLLTLSMGNTDLWQIVIRADTTFAIRDLEGGPSPFVIKRSPVAFSLTIDENQNVVLGAVGLASATPKGVLGLSAATVGPSAGVADAVMLYGKDSVGVTQLYVMDAGSQETKLSPHNEQGDWEYFSINKKTGMITRINMIRLIRDIEALTGKKYIEEYQQ